MEGKQAMNATTDDCPRVEDVSALIDGALSGARREDALAHAARCPLCGALLRDFETMGARLRMLRDVRCDVDLAALVAPQLAPRPRQGRRRRLRPAAWQVAPRGLAAAGALATGIYLGLVLAGGAAVAPRATPMAVFDAVPPGSPCASLMCAPRGR
jgi:hypothetical protein